MYFFVNLKKNTWYANYVNASCKIGNCMHFPFMEVSAVPSMQHIDTLIILVLSLLLYNNKDENHTKILTFIL